MARRYKIGGQTVERKHWWMPCVINARFDDMTSEEQGRALKATYWSDLVADREWPALLGHQDATKSSRFRLKKKAVGWLMALGRMAAINPSLFAEVCDKAVKLYREQIEKEHPFLGEQRQHRFEIDGHRYVWTPGQFYTECEDPDGEPVRISFEVGRVVSTERMPVAVPARPDEDDEDPAA